MNDRPDTTVSFLSIHSMETKPIDCGCFIVVPGINLFDLNKIATQEALDAMHTLDEQGTNIDYQLSHVLNTNFADLARMHDPVIATPGGH